MVLKIIEFKTVIIMLRPRYRLNDSQPYNRTTYSGFQKNRCILILFYPSIFQLVPFFLSLFPYRRGREEGVEQLRKGGRVRDICGLT